MVCSKSKGGFHSRPCELRPFSRRGFEGCAPAAGVMDRVGFFGNGVAEGEDLLSSSASDVVHRDRLREVELLLLMSLRFRLKCWTAHRSLLKFPSTATSTSLASTLASNIYT